MVHHQIKLHQSPRVTIYKEARAKYLDGIHSILQNLPVPTPSIKTLFDHTDRGISYANIPANQILNHFLALGYDCYLYQAGFDEDGIACENGMCYLSNNDHDHQHCEFFQDVHSDVKEMMINNPDIPKDMRVVIL